MDPHEDTLNLGATLPRTPTEMPQGPSAELELLHTIKSPGTGTLVFNRYQLQKVLGRGGMGVVWLANDTKLERYVALKFLPDVIGTDPVAVKELKDETRRGLDLAHPNIVRFYDFVDDDEAAAISMEYVNGKSLSEMRLSMPQHVFSVRDLAPWLGQMCDALDYAHQQRRLVHRDLKPANIMVNTESQVKITDFGIARTVSDTMSRLSMLRANTSGTLLYMSPQQAMGDRPKPTDDIYSVGATLYELLSGKPPFYSGDISMQITAKNAPSVRQRREELEIQAAEDIPREWEDAIALCLDKDPAKRPQTAGELARRLGVSVRTEPSLGVRVRSDGPKSIHVRTDRGVEAPAKGRQRSSRSRTWLPVAAVVFVLLGVAGAVGAWWWANRPALLMVNTEPSGAVVSVGGRTQMTPAVFDHLTPGRYVATISVEGFEPQTLEVSLKAGDKVSPAPVKLEQSLGTLLLSSDPDGVPYEVRLANDDKAQSHKGETPGAILLPVGVYEVTMRHEGELKTGTVDVGRNSENLQSFKFLRAEPSAPMLASSAPSPAATSSDPEDDVGSGPVGPDSPADMSPPAPAPAPGPDGGSGVAATANAMPPASPLGEPGPGPGLGLDAASPALATATPLPPAAMPPTAAPSADGTLGGSLAPSAPGAPAGAAGVPPTVPPLASPPTLAQQPPVATPPSGYWSLDEIFSASNFSGYSKNGRAYLLFEAQASLKEKSHYTAPVDGQVGKGTHKAIISFQSANGLTPTGQLDSSTISALGLSSMDDKSTWTPPQRRRRPSTRSGGSVEEDDSGWWRTNVADPFKRAFGR